MNKRIIISALASGAAALSLVACADNAEETASPEAETPAQEETFSVDEWVQDTFSSAPYLVQNATANPQAWVPDNGDGEPLPNEAAKDDVVWQLPACVLMPYTGNGPTNSQVTDGFVDVSGWEQSEEGAAAAAVALFAMSVEADDRAQAVATATGVSEQDAERLVATEEVFSSGSSFDDARTPQCDSALNRMTAWNVVDYSDNRAVVDYFVPMEDASTGGVLRMSVEWQDNDWKLSPSSFDSYHQAIENLSQAGGTGRAVDLEEFTQW